MSKITNPYGQTSEVDAIPIAENLDDIHLYRDLVLFEKVTIKYSSGIIELPNEAVLWKAVKHGKDATNVELGAHYQVFPFDDEWTFIRIRVGDKDYHAISSKYIGIKVLKLPQSVQDEA